MKTPALKLVKTIVYEVVVTSNPVSAAKRGLPQPGIWKRLSYRAMAQAEVDRLAQDGITAVICESHEAA